MIEKLSEYKITSRDGAFINADCNAKIINTLVRKINELVDAVNGILDYAPLEMAMKAEPEPADQYAEQRKWIGKLCRFWDDNCRITKHFGILTRIDETAIVRYEAGNGFWYCDCEPVKPDDDIIYKGGDNEQS